MVNIVLPTYPVPDYLETPCSLDFHHLSGGISHPFDQVVGRTENSAVKLRGRTVTGNGVVEALRTVVTLRFR